MYRGECDGGLRRIAPNPPYGPRLGSPVRVTILSIVCGDEGFALKQDASHPLPATIDDTLALMETLVSGWTSPGA